MTRYIKIAVVSLLFLMIVSLAQAGTLIKTVYPHIQFYKDSYQGAQIRYLKISHYSENFSLRASIPSNGIGYLEKLRSMVTRGGGIAGINANFYHTQNNMPVGLLIKDWEILSYTYGKRPCLVWDFFSGQLAFINPSFSLYAKSPAGNIKLDEVNSPLDPLSSPNQVVLYTPEYRGKLLLTSSGFWGEITEVRIKNQKVTMKRKTSSVPREDRDYYLILAHGWAESELSDLNWGTEVEIEYQIEAHSYIKTAVSAGPMLIKDGQIVLDPEKEDFDGDSPIIQRRTSRSAVGVTWDGTLILLVVLENYYSPGLDLWNLSKFFKQMGVKDAIAMDGGSSSTLVFKDTGSWQVVGENNPIAAGLILVPK